MVYHDQIPNKLVSHGTRTQIQSKVVHFNENKHEKLP